MAVQTRRAGAGSDIGRLDATAIERVQDEVRPDPRDVEELHDALLTSGFLLEGEIDRTWAGELASRARAAFARVAEQHGVWIAAERLPELTALHPCVRLEPIIAAPASRAARA